MLKREWGAESKGKLPQLIIPGKTAALVPEFAVEDLTLAELNLVPARAVKDLPLGRILDDIFNSKDHIPFCDRIFRQRIYLRY